MFFIRVFAVKKKLSVYIHIILFNHQIFRAKKNTIHHVAYDNQYVRLNVVYYIIHIYNNNFSDRRNSQSYVDW